MKIKHYAMIATALVAGVVLFTECASMRISYRRLPARAKTFVETFFPGERCVYAERDRDDGCREYEVKLANGTDIDFHASGDWKKVSCEYSFLPAGIVPQAIVDDLAVLRAAYEVTNRNPLGSAAGYGSSFPLDRSMTTDLLGFESMDYNVVYAQMGRGKTERIVANAIASIAATIGKLAFDACMFNSQNFGFIRLPDEFTTGSSIMPHKKNPDVFELTRAKCNKLQALPVEITLITNNLPSGYFRDLQLVKESFLPAFDTIISILDMTGRMLANIKVNTDVARDPRYRYMYSVEEVNRLAAAGTPFRDAYKQVGLAIERGDFNPDFNIHHTHEGSIGNLCNDRIRTRFDHIQSQFDFDTYHRAFNTLLGRQ